MTKKESKIYVLHENESWVAPLFASFDELNVPYVDWFINDGRLNLEDVPPEGVFYNRMSASAHSRSHRYAIELTESILSWLEFHGRKVINNRHALTLEVRKSEQQLSLNRFGISTPKTVVVNNSKDLIQAATELNLFPFIVKPNRGGKGLGV
ncbi:MAG: alpha-L-glutamate ligase, partial [Bacteroidia bacterium]|nr:alpha-L-glutamate ligase [Bacteroidia bacterium]